MNFLGNMFGPDKIAQMLFSFMPEAEIKQKIVDYTPGALEFINNWLNENVPLKDELEEIKHSLLLFEDNNTIMAQLVTLNKNWDISRTILTKDLKEIILSLELEKTLNNVIAKK
jgi:hypothetical protein